MRKGLGVKDLPVHETDRAEDVPGAQLPNALARKYPSATTSWEWFWMWPSHRLSTDPDTGIVRRHHHLHAETYRQALKEAVEAGPIT